MVLLWGWGILILCSIIQKVPPKTEVGGNQNLPQREGEQACFKITYQKSFPLDWRHWWGGRWAKKGKMWLRPCRLAMQNADAVFRARATRSLGLPFHDGCVCLFVDYCLLIHVANLISIYIHYRCKWTVWYVPCKIKHIDIFVFVYCQLNTLFSTWYVVCSLLRVIFLRGCLGMNILRPILHFQAGWIFRSSDRITICFGHICSWSFISSTVDNSVAIYAGCLQQWGKCNHGAVMCLHHGNPARFHWFTSILGMSGKNMWLSGFGIKGVSSVCLGLKATAGSSPQTCPYI